jgi:uncharacterized circularly permuted ATP-grasp superfamily protein/uncharacterized alpha-E superfamily protein
MNITGAAPASAEGTDVEPFYQSLPGVYDEMVGLGATVSPAWQVYADWFAETDLSVQQSYAQKIERLVFENFYDPQRGGHSWRLDLIPLILDQQTWNLVEAAAIQRARLYNHLLADLYGAQTVLSEGLLPSTLIYSDEYFLRPVHGIQPKHGHLTFLALDFARDPAGNWRVIDAHTETPAGHGFALANRTVLAEVAGDLFRQSHALRIGPFYQSLIDDLLKRAGGDDPMIAVLAPSPGASAFVGHSFMARYMGQRRVQGSDLRVVGNRVYLKTIDGLKKIDLLVRAIEGHKADPLELSPEGFEGPVGLVEACRRHPEIIVNAIGTAVVENRGLSGYLPGLARKFLGEDLVVYDTPRLWLGDPVARDEVLASLDRHIIHNTQEGTGSPGEAAPGRSAATLSPDQLAKLETDIHFHGPSLVAERPVGYATAPAWTPEGLRPEPYALRVYVSSIGGEFSVMPGGLALSVDEGATVALTSINARSRDVWVVSEDRVMPNITLTRITAQNATVQRHSQALQSRVADDLFWLGRYCERADWTLRIIRQTLHRSAADLLALSASQRPVKALRAILQQDTTTDNLAAIDAESGSLWSSLNELCTSADKLQGLPKIFESIRKIAVECRDRLSEDSWRILMGLSAKPVAQGLPSLSVDRESLPGAVATNALDIIEAAEDLLDRLSAFAGMSHENMTRNNGWLFMDLGRRVERAYQIATLLVSLFETSEGEDLDSDDMFFALQTADSFITYRSRYRFAPELHLVLDLLVIDETNPRSLAYQLASISDHIARLPKSADDAIRAPDQRLALEILTKVRLADVSELAEVNAKGTRKVLKALLNELIRELPHLSEHISRQYFSLADEQPQRLHF